MKKYITKNNKITFYAIQMLHLQDLPDHSFKFILKLCKIWQFLNFDGNEFHKIEALKAREFIPYFTVFVDGSERRLPDLKLYVVCFWLNISHMNSRFNWLRHLKISTSRNFKFWTWIESELSISSSSDSEDSVSQYTALKALLWTLLISSLLLFDPLIQINGQYLKFDRIKALHSRFALEKSRNGRILRRALVFWEAFVQRDSMCDLKVSLLSIKIPRILTLGETSTWVLPIRNVLISFSEIPRNIIWNFAGLAAIELIWNHSRMFAVSEFSVDTTSWILNLLA